jgi:hypothetical protein
MHISSALFLPDKDLQLNLKERGICGAGVEDVYTSLVEGKKHSVTVERHAKREGGSIFILAF